MLEDRKIGVDLVFVIGTSMKIPAMMKFLNSLKSENKNAVFVNIDIEPVKWTKKWTYELLGPCDWWTERLGPFIRKHSKYQI